MRVGIAAYLPLRSAPICHFSVFPVDLGSFATIREIFSLSGNCLLSIQNRIINQLSVSRRPSLPVKNGLSWQIQDFRPLQNFCVHSAPTVLFVRSYAVAHKVVWRAKARKIDVVIDRRSGSVIVRRLVGDYSATGLGGKSATFGNFDFTQRLLLGRFAFIAMAESAKNSA